jgi:hypothetical protein
MDSSTTISRDRRLAICCIGSFAVMFSMVSFLLNQVDGSSDREKGFLAADTKSDGQSIDKPAFVTRLDASKSSEWLLLPGVAKKTVDRWESQISSTTQSASSEVVTASAVESLEDLPGVGPVRAEQLAPFVRGIPAHPVSTSRSIVRKDPESESVHAP